MPTVCYATFEGTNQGNMHTGAMSADSVGTMSKDDKKDYCLVVGVDAAIEVPVNIQTGQPSGQRVHKGYLIQKIKDKATPMLMQALATGEQFKKVELEWYRTSTSGTQEKYATTTLEQATLVSMRTYMPNAQDPANANFGHLEELKFSYKKITETHDIAGTSGTDSWDNN